MTTQRTFLLALTMQLRDSWKDAIRLISAARCQLLDSESCQIPLRTAKLLLDHIKSSLTKATAATGSVVGTGCSG